MSKIWKTALAWWAFRGGELDEILLFQVGLLHMHATAPRCDSLIALYQQSGMAEECRFACIQILSSSSRFCCRLERNGYVPWQYGTHPDEEEESRSRRKYVKHTPNLWS